MRFLVLYLSFFALVFVTPAIGRAQAPSPSPPSVEPPPSDAPAEGAHGATEGAQQQVQGAAPSAPGAALPGEVAPPSAAPLSALPADDALAGFSAVESGDLTEELSLGDLWISRMSETRRRRQRLEHWLVPVLLGGAALGGVGTAVAAPGLSNSGRILSLVAGGVAAASMFPPMFSKPDNRGRWFLIGGGLFAMAYGASGFADSFAKRNKDCDGYCYNEKSVGWLGAAFFAQGLLAFPMALLQRGPSLDELEAYEQLPADQRPAAARKLLARIDRSERKAAIFQLLVNVIGGAIMGTGAVLVRDRSQRAVLAGFAGVTLGGDALGNITSLFRKTRLERLVLGESPDRIERVQW